MHLDKILILKNDRAGDLFTSLTLISTLNLNCKDITIYLSELNIGFSFFFNKMKIKKINFNLNFFNKLEIFFNILLNRYSRVYILTPKNFYFFLPLFFRKTKFYSIVYDSHNRKRPVKFLRKFLYKYKIVYRNKINKKSYRDLQSELIDDDLTIDVNHSSILIPKINLKLKTILPDNFLLFQFRYTFFEKLNWNLNEFDYLMTQILSKYNYILFSSDVENNKKSKFYNSYFRRNYSTIDTFNCQKIVNSKNTNIFFLDNINSENLFYLIKESKMNLAKEGIYSHISYFHKKKCHNLFNFNINSKNDFIHQKISYSEWCKNMNFSFSFLNDDIKKASKKILRNI